MTVLFVSDIHLKPERPDLTRAFSHFLDTTAQGADALYLLGDIFEAWIGDDTPADDLQPLFKRLRNLQQSGCQLYFQHGNRDFLVGEQFTQSIGAELLPEQVQITLPVGDAVILHGDQLCTDDSEYMQFRALVRNPEWQADFLSNSLPQRIAIARQLRDASKARGAEKAEYITDVNTVAVAAVFEQYHVDLMIHGHTHRPKIHQHQLADREVTRIVLGDWDKLGWYLKVDQDGYELISFPI
jgi:UDP-2,3-diacylglucosamine hydrolase